MADVTTNAASATFNSGTNRIAPNVSVGSFFANPAVELLNAGTSLDVFGDIYGIFGVLVDENSPAMTVWGSGSIYGSSIGIDRSLSSLVNRGDIYGDSFGYSLSGLPVVVTKSIVNYGTIASGETNASKIAIAGSSATFGPIALVNHGLIIGGTAIAGTPASDTITNYGTIRGVRAIQDTAFNNQFPTSTLTIVNTGVISGTEYAVSTTVPTLSLTNSGRIEGSIQTGGDSNIKNDDIINTGTIIGAISLGGGGDTYDGEFGTLNGTLNLGNGEDTATGGSFAETISGGDGDDTLNGGGGNDILNGDADNDELYGDDGNDTLNGGAGVDTLDGGAGIDIMRGNAGNDKYFVDHAGDKVYEASGEGEDTVYTSVSYKLIAGQEIENLTADAEAGNISLTGNTFINTLTGNAGNNRLDGGAEADTMIGGDGDDSYYVDNAGDTVTELEDEGTDTIYTTIDLTLSENVENLRAKTPASITGLQLIGNTLDNMIVGAAGNDIIDGGTGADRMIGYAGNDIYVIDDIGDVVIDSAGFDTVVSSISYRLGSQIEVLQLTGGDDIDGTGNTGDNFIAGNTANNTLTGLGGSDKLIGDLGNDTFLFNAPLGPTNIDNILDFKGVGGGDIDLIALDARYFPGIKALIGTNSLDPNVFATPATKTASTRIIYDEDYEFVIGDGMPTPTLLFDRDGTGTKFAAIPFAIVCGCNPVVASDFIVV